MALMANSQSVCTGICTGHSPPIPMTGSITTFSGDCLGGPGGSARVGDTVTGLCGHTGVITTGSATVTINGQPAARVGSAFSGVFSGTVTTGVPTIPTG